MMVIDLNNSCGLSLQMLPLPQLFAFPSPPNAEFQQTLRDRR
ncbi:hypothetical protein [Laspinema olomoucense]|nr:MULTISPECIES: hypothetical protein [unclassified Laspinema]